MSTNCSDCLTSVLKSFVDKRIKDELGDKGIGDSFLPKAGSRKDIHTQSWDEVILAVSTDMDMDIEPQVRKNLIQFLTSAIYTWDCIMQEAEHLDS